MNSAQPIELTKELINKNPDTVRSLGRGVFATARATLLLTRLLRNSMIPNRFRTAFSVAHYLQHA